jgi:hypothetical protein
MSYSELIHLYFDRSAALQNYWTLYVIIIGGLLAFSSLRQRKDLITAILITLLFSFFAYKNASAIIDTLSQRNAALDAIKSFPASGADAPLRQKIEPTLIVQDPSNLQIFHLTCDLLTLATLWAMELRRIRTAKLVPPAPTPTPEPAPHSKHHH